MKISLKSCDHIQPIRMFIWLALFPSVLGLFEQNGDLLRRSVVNTRGSSKTIVHGYIPGDVMLGGLFSVHDKVSSEKGYCIQLNEEVGIHRLEAMLFAIDQINNDTSLLINMTLGGDVQDDCHQETTSLERSIEFVLDTIATRDEICGKRSLKSLVNAKPFAGVVGPSFSTMSMQIASLLRLFKIPQISYGATSVDLSDKEKYTYFLRTVAPDTYQSKAILDIVTKLQWTAVHTVNSRGNYAERALEAFLEYAGNSGVCVVTKNQLPDKPTPKDYDKVIERLMSEKLVRGVIMFTENQDIRGILSAAQRIRKEKNEDEFIWVGSDTWATRTTVVAGLRDVAEGAITIALETYDDKLTPFKSYFTSLRPESYTRNPWFKEFWMKTFNCKLPSSNTTVYENNCTGNETLETLDRIDNKVPFVIDAVHAFAHSLDKLYTELCPEQAGVCDEMRTNIGDKMLSYLQNVSFPGMTGQVHFDKNGDSVGRYVINTFRAGAYKTVGNWKNGVLSLDVDELNKDDQPIESQCGRACPVGHVRKTQDLICCWSCVKCDDRYYVLDEWTCKDCGIGSRPNYNFTACEPLPQRHLTREWTIGLSCLSSVGIVIALFVLVTFIRYNDTALVKASAREMSYLILCGILMCYVMVFVLVSYPSPAVCNLRRVGVGLGFCLCYAALLTKTNRLARIFSGRKALICITPSSQIFITIILVCPILAITIAVLVLVPSKYGAVYYGSEYTFVNCIVTNVEGVITFSYNMILVVILTGQAYKTRHTPVNLNEARYIGFCMYTSCLLWFVFLLSYFLTETEYQIIALSIHTTLNALTLTVFIFGNRVYTILFKPEKNTSRGTRKRTFSDLPQDFNYPDDSRIDNRRRTISTSTRNEFIGDDSPDNEVSFLEDMSPNTQVSSI